MTTTGARRLADSLAAGNRHRYGSKLPRVAGAGIRCVAGGCSWHGRSTDSISSAIYWDHCHIHGLIRGPVCGSCNCQMAEIDAGQVWQEPFISHHRRCPECPPGRPPITRKVLKKALKASYEATLWHSGYTCALECDITREALGLGAHQWSDERIRDAQDHIAGKDGPTEYIPWELREYERTKLRNQTIRIAHGIYATSSEIQRLLDRKGEFRWRGLRVEGTRELTQRAAGIPHAHKDNSRQQCA
jgi:hypothetical protein